VNDVAVTFFIATNIDECSDNSLNVHFDEDIHSLIYNERTKLPFESSVLYSLDPYGTELLSSEKILQLIDISKKLKIHFENNQEVIDFSYNLLWLCNYAITENKSILSLGD
jgi:hypothetical protein